MPKFVGGCADGQLFEVQKIGGRYPSVQYLSRQLSLAEMHALRIDDNTARKPPEDVYYLRDEEYVFDRTVHYKPLGGEDETPKDR